MLLRLIGSSPVNAIDTAHPDAVNARSTLNRIRRKAQKRGWWFNITYNVEYQPDPVSKEIRIPTEITTAVTSERYVVRGNRLYDKYQNTFQFEAPVTVCREVRTLDWDDMPLSMQEYCAYYAGAEFVRDEIEDLQKKEDLTRDAGIAMLDIKKEDLEQGGYNMFNNRRILNARAPVKPYSRSHKRFYGTPDV